MKTGSLVRLVARPSSGVTALILAALIGVVISAERILRESMSADPHLSVYFSFVYLAITLGGVVSAGGFLSRSLVEIENLRLAPVLPGVRRKLARDVIWLGPLVATVALVFLRGTAAGQFRAVTPGTLWCVNLFLFSVGLGLGWSWLVFVVFTALVARLSTVIGFLESSPVLAGSLALAGAIAVLLLRYRGFCAREGSGSQRWSAFLRGPFDRRTETRRTIAGAADDSSGVAASDRRQTMSPFRAGLFERFGSSRGALARKVLLSLATIYGGFGLFLIGAAKNNHGGASVEFFGRVFAGAAHGQQLVVLHILFAAISGFMGFLGALTLDLSLQPNLWRPLSRASRARAEFSAHLVQNLGWAALQAIVALGVCLGAARWSGVNVSPEALRAYLMPAAVGLLLAPLPQALFPHGAETFRAKTNSLVQLAAGLLGAACCLMTVYWSAHWPSTTLELRLPLSGQIASYVAAVTAVYVLFFLHLKFRYARSDLGRRSQ